MFWKVIGGKKLLQGGKSKSKTLLFCIDGGGGGGFILFFLCIGKMPIIAVVFSSFPTILGLSSEMHVSVARL